MNQEGVSSCPTIAKSSPVALELRIPVIQASLALPCDSVMWRRAALKANCPPGRSETQG